MLSCAIALTPAAYAQAWVSVNFGNDTNPCTRTLPCLTFARAVNVTPASGQLNVLDPGDYGSVVITKAMTLDGGGFAANVTTSGNAITVEAGAGQVVQLMNLSLHGNGGTYGISYLSGSQLVIQNVTVNGFFDGVYSSVTGSATADLVVKDTSIDNCTNGMYITSSASLTVEMTNSHLNYNTASALSLNAGRASITGSTFSSPSISSNAQGIYLGAGVAMIDNCQLSGFEFALNATSGTTMQINRTTFSHNINALYNDQGQTGTIYTNGNNSFFNNSTTGTQYAKPVALL